MAGKVLLCDFSLGSHIRLGLAVPGHRPENIVLYGCSAREEFEEVITGFLASAGQPHLVGAAIASRGWERGGVVHLPEEGFTLVRDDIRQLLGVQRVNLVNNFVARALAIPHLKPNEAEQIYGAPSEPEQITAVLGPHIGLGLAALSPDGLGGWIAIPTEGGHSILPCQTPRQWAVYEQLAKRFGYVSREMALSMTGLSNVWRALVEIEGVDTMASSPEEVVALAATGDPLALETIELCLIWLAGMASDIGIIYSARGGVYLNGDMIDLMGDLFNVDLFREHYLQKGRMSELVAEIPVYRALTPDLELIGLSTLFE